ncbi:iron dicitrate transport regulator FecR [Methylosinus sp. R-45379]|uniref:FecR family protein n=1 Tax=Methylosinus sp. R-45379 TaxID=980563 RepID=UPI0007C97B16|nr:FecR domain-containing protein [Methylosinus sp. R-45379]OAI27625.1 iron dicitrate transport regulator FecR [Methylosinus sp. R-45379]
MTDYSDGFDHDSPRVAAVNWWIRMRAGALSAAEKAEFDAWRAADPANAAAFDDMAEMCGFVESLAPSRQAEPPRAATRRPSLAGVATIAAALCLAIAVGFGDLATWLRSDIYAGVGDRKSVTLEDGSRVELNASSAIALHFEPGRRRLTLLEGEAWFQVAPDTARPFVVEAAGGSVTALGTAFDIAIDKGEARVTVTEHSVAVASGGASVVVGEGAQSAFSAERAARAPEAVDVKRATAWRRGRLIFENKPLGEVLAALGRHRRGYVYCIGEASCARRVTGVFDAENPAQALREIEAFLGLRAIQVTDYLILLHG